MPRSPRIEFPGKIDHLSPFLPFYLLKKDYFHRIYLFENDK